MCLCHQASLIWADQLYYTKLLHKLRGVLRSIIPQDGWAHPFPNMESWNVDCQGGRPRTRLGKECPHWTTTINCPLFLSSSLSPSNAFSFSAAQPYKYVLSLPLPPRFGRISKGHAHHMDGHVGCRITLRSGKMVTNFRLMVLYTRIKSLKEDVDISQLCTSFLSSVVISELFSVRIFEVNMKICFMLKLVKRHFYNQIPEILTQVL